MDVPDPEEFKIEIGFGVAARSGSENIVVGKEDFLRDRGMQVPPWITWSLAKKNGKPPTRRR